MLFDEINNCESTMNNYIFCDMIDWSGLKGYISLRI